MCETATSSTIQILQHVKSGDVPAAALNSLALDPYEVLVFVASELLVLKSLAENIRDNHLAQDLERVCEQVIEAAKNRAGPDFLK